MSNPVTSPTAILHDTPGHAFSQNVISGGTVHLGDTYYLSDDFAASRRRKSDAGRSQLYIVPRSSTAQFTGRTAQLEQIRHLLTDPSPSLDLSRHRTVVLSGLGGSGKSQVCLRYAEIHREKYGYILTLVATQADLHDRYWGVFWIDVSSRSSAEAGYGYLGQRAGLGPTWTTGLYWLSQCIEPWLLILDNADDLQMNITDFFPSGDSGHILITTRSHDMCIHANPGHLVFGKMDPEEAIQLLLKSAYADARPLDFSVQQTTAATGIAAALGYLAIALNQAGATIRRKIYTIEEYLVSYLGDRKRLLNSRHVPLEEINVITTWEIPFRQLEQRRSTEYQDAVVLMCIFAFLHFESIPENLLLEFSLQQDHEAAWSSEVPDVLQSGSRSRLRRAASILLEHSIIDLDAANTTYSLHPVVHQWARSRIDDDEEMEGWLRCTLCLLSSCKPEKFTAAHRMSILPHLDYCLDVARQCAPTIFKTPQGVDQLERYAGIYEANGAWNKALPMLEESLQYRLKHNGWWHERTLTLQRSIARSHWNLFQVGAALEMQLKIRLARWYLRPSLRDWSRFSRPDHLSYCLALDDLTQTLWLAGLTEESKMVGLRAMHGLSKRLGDDDPRTWNAMFNLGRTFRHTGRLDAAHKLLSFVVEKRKTRLGLDHPDTLTARNELGMSFWARGKHLAIAQSIVSRVRDARSRVLGRDHAYTLWSVNDLSKILCSRGRPAHAVRILEEIVPCVAQTLGDGRVGMHTTKGNLARSHALCRHWETARAILLGLFRAVDESHKDWFHFMYGYVRVETELGRVDEAERACHRMLARVASAEARPASAASTPHFRSATELLASVYLRAGRLEDLRHLRSRHPWINEDNVRNPLSPVEFAHAISRLTWDQGFCPNDDHSDSICTHSVLRKGLDLQ